MLDHTSQRQQDLQDRARAVFPAGVNSNIRRTNPPVIAVRGQGCRFFDADGKEYIDYILGQGPNFLGFSPDPVIQAVERAMRSGTVYACTSDIEIEAGEAVIESLGWVEQLRFGSSSTEMVQAALRVARCATGARKIVRFRGHYHGWLDNIAIGDGPEVDVASAGSLDSALDDLVVLDWNDLDALKSTLDAHRGEIAAVIMESIMMNVGCIEPLPGYLAAVKSLCHDHGVVFILDETITGFRVSRGGAAELYGVVPDLAIYGKAMAGGFPCAALAGSRELLSHIGPGEVVHAGTFNGNTIAAAATLATMKVLAEPHLYERLNEVGGRLRAGLSDISQAHDAGLFIQGLPMAFHARFPEEMVTATTLEEARHSDADRYRLLVDSLTTNGVWVASRGLWYVGAAHSERDVDETLDRFESSLTTALR